MKGERQFIQNIEHFSMLCLLYGVNWGKQVLDIMDSFPRSWSMNDFLQEIDQ